MKYPDDREYGGLIYTFQQYAKLKCEYGANAEVAKLMERTEQHLRGAIDEVKALQEEKTLREKEPDDLDAIRSLSAGGFQTAPLLDCAVYRDKLRGALTARFAGCLLGAPVEMWTMQDIRAYAQYLGMGFPITGYWKEIQRPFALRYQQDLGHLFTESGMDGVPVDDDIAYTLVGLLILEECGKNFTTEDVARIWTKYIPIACTAEDVALRNFKKGIPALEAAEIDNPFCQFIGADIRSDPWGYVCPGDPVRAAALAYRDAYFTHRRNGIYGSMFFAAAIAQAFCVAHPYDALTAGLRVIPQECRLYEEIRWALEAAQTLHCPEDARELVDRHFEGMDGVHTINNACLTVFGLLLGGTDVSKVITWTASMGLDNDCNAATAGSIVGAISGFRQIPAYWYQRFNNRIHSYLNGISEFSFDELVERFEKIGRG